MKIIDIYRLSTYMQLMSIIISIVMFRVIVHCISYSYLKRILPEEYPMRAGPRAGSTSNGQKKVDRGPADRFRQFELFGGDVMTSCPEPGKVGIINFFFFVYG